MTTSFICNNEPAAKKSSTMNTSTIVEWRGEERKEPTDAPQIQAPAATALGIAVLAPIMTAYSSSSLALVPPRRAPSRAHVVVAAQSRRVGSGGALGCSWRSAATSGT
jgi:hypothetical protein